MLALASLLVRLRDDPETVGKRYQLTVRLNPFEADAVERIPGVADASERYQSDVADAYRLGEPLRIVAYPGDHTRFEAPPLAEGRRLRGAGEAEVGVGLADALGLRPGATLAVQRQGGDEARFRVVGVVRALERDGRIAYVRPRPAAGRRAGPGLDDRGQARARRRPGAVERDLEALGAPPQAVAAATSRNAALPRRARDRAARRRARGRARVPVRAGPGAGDDRARAARRGRAAARLRRRRAHGRRSCSPARRWPSRCRPRSPACCSSGSCSAPLVARLAAGYADAAARARARPGRARRRRPAPARRGRDGAGRPPRAARADPRGAAGGVMARAAARPAPRRRAARRLRRRRPRRRRPARRCARTLVDPDGDGALERGPGEPLRDRTDLGGRAARRARSSPRSPSSPTPTCATRSRPARVPFLDRLGGAFALHVPPAGGAQHAGARRGRARRRRGSRPTRSFVTGDILDSAESVELDQALAVLDGGRVDPDTGAPGLRSGVQARGAARTRFFYRPGPRRAAPSRAARRAPQRPFRSPGLRRAVVPGARQPRRARPGRDAADRAARRVRHRRRGWSRRSTRAARARPATRTRRAAGRRAARLARPADPRAGRPAPAPPATGELIARLTTRDAAPDALRARGRPPTLDYAVDLGRRARALVLDTADRAGGSRGLLRPAQLAWLRARARRAPAAARCSSSPTTRSTTRAAATRRSPRSTPPRAWSP